MRLYFATDLHGSEVAWRKLLRSADFYDADLVICGGDLTGKALQLIIREGDELVVTQHGNTRRFAADELHVAQRHVADQGLDSFVAERDEAEELLGDQKRLTTLYDALVIERLEQWVAMADERLGQQGRQMVIMSGNDDPPAVDEVLATSKSLINGEGELVELPGGYGVLSSGWTNPSPWATYREEPEDLLAERLSRLSDRAVGFPEDRLILNLHCPPHGTALDEAPVLDDSLQAKGGIGHVGSRAVRTLIEDIQPALSLHGHIHEARATVRLGSTLAVNPGSSYQRGILLGAVIGLPNRKSRVKDYSLTWG
jgi:Icc-related predicted phosphoesterase